MVMGTFIKHFQHKEKYIITMLSNCTAEFSLESGNWRLITTDDNKMGVGGDLIKGADEKLYYMGGIHITSGNKSKEIFEFQETSWSKWPKELNVDVEALNAWGVMEIGPKFCSNRTTLTKAISYEEGWVLNKPDPSTGICVKNLFEGEGTHNEC